MFKVILYDDNEIASEYSTAQLQYAKRYADLYKSEYTRVEIIAVDNDDEHVIESFADGR